jgi:hypothetical protein
LKTQRSMIATCREANAPWLPATLRGAAAIDGPVINTRGIGLTPDACGNGLHTGDRIIATGNTPPDWLAAAGVTHRIRGRPEFDWRRRTA